MKFKIVPLCCLLIFISEIKSQLCTSQDIPSFDTEEINTDAAFEGEVVKYLMDNTLGIDSYTETVNGKQTNYMNAQYTSKDLVISTNPAFTNYEENEISTSLFLRIELKCLTSTKVLVIKLNIIAANNHPPVFSESLYEIKIPLPLPKELDITFLTKISARDIDLINNRVTFTSDIEYPVVVGTSNIIGDDGKTFYATLMTTQQIIKLDADLVFTITATDSGNPPKTGTALIKLTTDSRNIEQDGPTFEKFLYTGTLSNQLTLRLENVIVTEKSYSNEIDFVLKDYDFNLFTFSQNRNQLTIQLKPNVIADDFKDKTLLQFILVASLPYTTDGTTVITIRITDIVYECETAAKFSKSLYTGNLADDWKSVNLETITLIDNEFSNNVLFSLESFDSTFFDFVTIEKGLNINLKKPLTEENLSSKNFFMFVVVASSGDDIAGRTGVVIDVLKKDCVSEIAPNHNSKIGFLAAVSVLAVLLTILSVFTFLLWWFSIRPYKIQKRISENNSNLSQSKLENDFNINSNFNPVKSEYPLSNGGLEENKPDDVDNPEPATFLISMLEETVLPEQTPTRKKSIKFNEMVERIDIPIDNEKENKV